MADEDDIIVLLKKAVGLYGVALVKTCDCEVISVDEDTNTCIVRANDGKIDLDNFKVRYRLEKSDGFNCVPLKGSTVSIIFSDFAEPYVASNTDLSKISFSINKQTYVNDGTKQQFNDGGYGGIPKIVDPNDNLSGLLKRINLIEDQINKIGQKWDAFCSVYLPGSPSTTGLPANLSTSTVGQIVKTSKTQIENENITHGKEIK